jgi:hypothetical protein
MARVQLWIQVTVKFGMRTKIRGTGTGTSKGTYVFPLFHTLIGGMIFTGTGTMFSSGRGIMYSSVRWAHLLQRVSCILGCDGPIPSKGYPGSYYKIALFSLKGIVHPTLRWAHFFQKVSYILALGTYPNI